MSIAEKHARIATDLTDLDVVVRVACGKTLSRHDLSRESLAHANISRPWRGYRIPEGDAISQTGS
jgi:hypothetical protein